LKLNRKIGVVAAVAALLLAAGVFGVGRQASADIPGSSACPFATNGTIVSGTNGPCVYILSQHLISQSFMSSSQLSNPTFNAGALTGTSAGRGSPFDCANGPNASSVTTANFPPAVGSLFLNTGTNVNNPTGLPLVEINALSAAGSILNSTNTSFINQSFIVICVQTTGGPTPGVAGGTLDYNTLGGAAGAAGIQDDGDLTFSAIVQSNMGFFDQPSCTDPNGNSVVGEWTGDRCVDTTGEGTAQLEIPAIPPSGSNNLNTVIVRFNCSLLSPGFQTGVVFPITIQQDAGSFTFNVICKGSASAGATTISATPNTVEIIPARSNTSHSLILLKIQSSFGTPVFPGTDVQFTTDRCAIETAGLGTGTSAITDVFGVQATNVPNVGTLSDGPNVLSLGAAIAMTSQLNTAAPGTYLTWEFSAPAQTPVDVLGGFAPFGTNAFSPQADITKAVDGFDLDGNGVPDFSLAGAILSCNPVQASNPTPGTANIQGCVAVANAVDVCVTTTVKVIGPPASITVAASPTSVNCGEKATITATVVDAIGQNVSDHTRVELVTNLGGVIGGTGAVAGFAANVAPISSSVADTFGGVATGFLLTSDVTTGPYEVVATSGGTTSGDFAIAGGGVNAFDFGLSPFGFNIAPQFVNNLGQVGVNFLGTPVSGTAFNLLGTPINSNPPFTAFPTQTFLGGQFSTPPISAQVTVNCALPVAAAPAVPQLPPVVQAPRTGTGIIPPNTGDAGLAGSSSASWTLFSIGGLVVLGLSGLTALRLARR